MPAKQVKIRRGTTTEHSVFVGEIGEITVDTTKNTVVVHDKTLQGGNPLAKENMSNVFNSVGIQQLEASEGSANDVLTTNGMGGLSFSPVDISSQLTLGGDLSGTVSNAQIVPKAVGINELDVSSDGSNGQALITNGSGQLSFGSVSVAQNSIGVIELNLSDGLNGQVLTTDGNANLSFQTPVTNPVMGGDLSGLASNANIVNDTVGIAELDVNDGNSGQILSTNGNGQLVFVNNVAGGQSSETVEDIVTGDGIQTEFTFPSGTIVTVKETILLFIDGVSQPLSTFTLPTTTSISITPAPFNGAEIKILHLGIMQSGLASGSSNFVEDLFVGASGQTDFTLTEEAPTKETILVYVDGVSQSTQTYSLPNLTTIRFVNAPLTNSSIRVLHLGIATNGNSAVGGDVSGIVSNIEINPNVVGSNEIADNAVGIDQLSVSSDGNAGEFLQTNGAGILSFAAAVGSTGFTGMQVFDTPGAFTWTKPTGVKSVLFFATGGGGGGLDSSGGGGAGGGTSMGFVNVSSIVSESVTVGAGGIRSATSPGTGSSSLFGSHGTGIGGGGGQSVAGNNRGSSIGGSATGGNFTITGGRGTPGGFNNGTNLATGGTGGTSFFAGVGGGGEGGLNHNPGGTLGTTGTNGFAGAVVILEFA